MLQQQTQQTYAYARQQTSNEPKWEDERTNQQRQQQVLAAEKGACACVKYAAPQMLQNNGICACLHLPTGKWCILTNVWIRTFKALSTITSPLSLTNWPGFNTALPDHYKPPLKINVDKQCSPCLYIPNEHKLFWVSACWTQQTSSGQGAAGRPDNIVC